MKTIFMCVNYPLNEPSVGISKKIRMQINTFQELGYQVTYSAYVDEGIAVFKNEKKIKVYPYGKHDCDRIKRLKRRFMLMDACSDFLALHNFDLGYIRWDAIDKGFLRVLETMRVHCKKTVMDSHGYFKNLRASNLKGEYIVATTKLNWRKLRGLVDFVIGESREQRIFGIPSMTADTGIDVERYRAHRYTGSLEELNLISVSNETSYHGCDRLIKGLYDYRRSGGDVVVKLHLVGEMMKRTKKMVEKLKMDHVIFYGYQSGENLQQIYEACNMGVGPLAPHRVGGKEGTGIKTKEYFAIGLPYVYAGQELIVPDDYPYVCRLDDDETPIEIEKIIGFYERIKYDQEMQTSMRLFAEENFSWKKIYTEMLRRME